MQTTGVTREGVRPLLLLLPTALLLAGCVTTRVYDGPPLPASERAIVRADPPVSADLPVQVRLRQVDGRDIPVQASAVELAPGAHELLVDCRATWILLSMHATRLQSAALASRDKV